MLASWRENEPRIDASNMRDRVHGFPADLQDGVARAFDTAVALRGQLGEAGSIVVAGMGGSAIGADLAAAYTERKRRCPVHVVRGYGLPPWVGDESVVVVSSYSGDTEETVACYETARERGLRTVAITTGGRVGEVAAREGDPVISLPTGYPPRAALGYSWSAVALTLAALDPGLDIHEEHDRFGYASERVNQLSTAWLAWEPENPVLKVAHSVVGRTAVIYGGHPVGIAASVRWKGQLNENAKLPAFHGYFPEHNHNEIVGFEAGGPAVEQLALVYLETPLDAPRVQQRYEIAYRFCDGRVGKQHRVAADPKDPLGAAAWLCHFGDCASFLASIIGGQDPTPVASIDALKNELRGRQR